MTEYLLDTHSLLWWDSVPERIGPEALNLLRHGEGGFYVSHATVWEIAIKHSLGKLTLPLDLESWIQDSIVGNGFSLVPIGLKAIVETTRLPFHHRDPFDRLLIAQARVGGWTVLGADSQWDAYGVKRVW